MNTCNCVERINESVKKHYGPDAYVETKFGCSVSTGESWLEFPPLVVRHRAKNAKGAFTKKWVSGILMHNFCPMCGKSKRKATTETEQKP